MSMDLNLLPSQAKFQAKKNQLMVMVRRWNYIFGALWFIVLVTIFVWWKLAETKLESSQRNYKEFLANYEGLSEGAVMSES